VIDLDSYYLDRSDVEQQQRTILNYDDPAAFDIRLLSRLPAVYRDVTVTIAE
jgi:uridine kinase